MVVVVFGNLNTCVLVFLYCVCVWSGQSEFMAFFVVFNLWNGPGFVFEPCS